MATSAKYRGMGSIAGSCQFAGGGYNSELTQSGWLVHARAPEFVLTNNVVL